MPALPAVPKCVETCSPEGKKRADFHGAQAHPSSTCRGALAHISVAPCTASTQHPIHVALPTCISILFTNNKRFFRVNRLQTLGQRPTTLMTRPSLRKHCLFVHVGFELSLLNSDFDPGSPSSGRECRNVDRKGQKCRL
uniref:Uncharacterized protein n=1 Tax=Panagrellus redivivus TaxID=6233 RepID=A0A7E4UM16_PANRE